MGLLSKPIFIAYDVSYDYDVSYALSYVCDDLLLQNVNV